MCMKYNHITLLNQNLVTKFRNKFLWVWSKLFLVDSQVGKVDSISHSKKLTHSCPQFQHFLSERLTSLGQQMLELWAKMVQYCIPCAWQLIGTPFGKVSWRSLLRQKSFLLKYSLDGSNLMIINKFQILTHCKSL